MQYLRSPRAKTLFDEVNKRYFEFASQLPAPLDALARTTGTFEGTANETTFNGLPDLNPGLAGIPWLFWEPFSSLDDSVFLRVSEASMYSVFASVVMDHILDNQGGPTDAMSLFHKELYWRGVAGYQRQFDSQSVFWDHFDRLATSNSAGLSIEIRAQSNPELHSLETLEAASYGKASPLITSIAGLAIASDQASLLQSIEATIKYIMVASQMLDDLGDWEHDLQVDHKTLYLVSLAPEAHWNSAQKPSVKDLQGRIDDGWLDVRQADAVIEWLDRSLEAVSNIDCPAWVEYVNGYRTLADKHANNFTARHLVRILEPMTS
jgi:hypothetical protein